MAFNDALAEIKNERDQTRRRVLRINDMLSQIDTTARDLDSITVDAVRGAREELGQLWYDLAT